MIVAFPIWALFTHFGSYAQGLAAAYPVVLIAALIFLLPGYSKSPRFLPSLAAMALLHVVGVIILRDRFADISPSMFMLAFSADLLASLGLFIAVGRLRNDPDDPFEKVQTMGTPSPPGDKGVD